MLTQALNETEAGIIVNDNRRLLSNNQQDEEEHSDLCDEPGHLKSPMGALRKPHLPALGSGLKRSLASSGHDSNPVIKKRQRLSKAKPAFVAEIEPFWEGFNSEDDSSHSLVTASSLSNSASTDSGSDQDSIKESDESLTNEGSSGLANKVEIDHDEERKRMERSSAFKAWATQQVNETLGFTPSSTSVDVSEALLSSSLANAKRPTVKPRSPDYEPLPAELEVKSNLQDRQVYHIDVVRSPEIHNARLGLPVVAEEQKIMEAIYSNTTVVIWGTTGSGKTTQVPQFLFEAGFGSSGSPNPGKIGITQTRRVAAVSMAKRVADELGKERDKVSYQIRFDSSVSDKTAIKFMTDGILIREIADDFALLKYSVIIIDEAHERSANTDILIGMVSRIIDLRASMSTENRSIQPLKMVIMSATLQLSDFLHNRSLFRNGVPPVIQAEGRQYPVTTHFARRTERDYLEEIFRKICRGHKKLPPGGMLVFLTGQNEINTLAKRLREAFADGQGVQTTGPRVCLNPREAPSETEDLVISRQQYGVKDVDEDDDGDGSLFDHEDDREFDVEDSTPSSSKVHVLPLYSQLQTKDQLRVFEPPPANSRTIILATNVAETSLTIPGIRYVFDSGRAKKRIYNRSTGVQSFEVAWISKASASQRAGRAGRTGPGHCYRLYSSAVYERDFEEHAEPEILRMPVEGVVLQLKSMDLQHIVNFPFPTAPDRQSLAKAEKLLSYLGALSPQGKITSIGRDLSYYPLSPRFSKMLTIGHQHGCMPHTVALVAALATPNLFIPEFLASSSTQPQPAVDPEDEFAQADETLTKNHKAYNHAHHLFSRHSSTSDALKTLTALCAYAYAPSKEDFCEEMFLSPKAIAEASNLASQLTTIVHNNNPTLLSPSTSLRLPSPSRNQISALQQIVAAAFIDQVAILHSAHSSPPDLPRKPARAIDVPYFPLFPVTSGRKKEDIDINDKAIFIHPSSILAHLPVGELPTYVVYAHLQRSTPSTIEGSKKPRTRMHALGAVSGKQIAALARGTPLLVYGKPIGRIEEVDGGMRRCWVVPSLVGEKGDMGWPLPAQKVLQKKDQKGDWVVEEVIG